MLEPGFESSCLALPCLGPLAPRGAVGARHDGLPRQFSPLLPVVCHGLSLSEGFAGPLCDVITPALFRPAPSSTVPCSITLVRPSDLVTCPYHFSFRRFTVSQDTYARTRILLLHFKTWAILFSSHCPSSLRKRSCYTCKHTLHTSCMHISTNIILTVIHKLHKFMHKPRILFSYIFISN